MVLQDVYKRQGVSAVELSPGTSLGIPLLTSQINDIPKCFRIEKDAQIPFNNKVDYCIGTGRMGLALQKEYQEQLALVQEEIGFSHIRGHGLFSDDMAIYQEYTDENGKDVYKRQGKYLYKGMECGSHHSHE